MIFCSSLCSSLSLSSASIIIVFVMMSVECPEGLVVNVVVVSITEVVGEPLHTWSGWMVNQVCSVSLSSFYSQLKHF